MINNNSNSNNDNENNSNVLRSGIGRREKLMKKTWALLAILGFLFLLLAIYCKAQGKLIDTYIFNCLAGACMTYAVCYLLSKRKEEKYRGIAEEVLKNVDIQTDKVFKFFDTILPDKRNYSYALLMKIMEDMKKKGNNRLSYKLDNTDIIIVVDVNVKSLYPMVFDIRRIAIADELSEATK